MKQLKKAFINASVAALFLGTIQEAWAVSIKVIDQGLSFVSFIQDTKIQLTTLGYTVTDGGTLTDYSAFDEVWDLRINVPLVAADITAMGNYLAGGGRMFLLGEWGFDGSSSFASRSLSLVNWVNAVGGGSLSLANPAFFGLQPVTTQGQIVTSPNNFAALNIGTGSTINSPGSGFLVSETSVGSGEGTVVAWNFGDISGKPSARMVVSFDANINSSTYADFQNWNHDIATYLAPVPEPSAAALSGLAGTILFRFRRIKKLN